MRINYGRISLRHKLSKRCRKIVKFVSITHSERNIWNGLIVANAISREKDFSICENMVLQNPPIIYTHPALSDSYKTQRFIAGFKTAGH
jgi:hypothetical protein